MSRIPVALGLEPGQVEGLLVAAGRAPSLHNSQPWRFHITPHAIEVHAEPERIPRVADPEGREVRMACGAALYNLRLALHGHGVRPAVTVCPDRDRPDLLAVVRFGGLATPTPEQTQLLRAVTARRTNRHPFTGEAVVASDQNALRRAAVEEGAWLHIVADHAQRETLRELAARAHRTQTADPAFRTELAAWSTTSPERLDGVPILAAGAIPEPQDRWVMRDFTGGAGRTRVPGKDFEEHPVIAVLASYLSGPRAEVEVGEALQRILLTATAAGLDVSFLSQLVEVSQTREELRGLIGARLWPQAVLRIGYGWPVVTTPRRRTGELLTTSEPTPSR